MLTLVAYLFVLVVGLIVIGLLAWGLRRMGAEIGSAAPPQRRERSVRRPAPAS